MTAKVLHIVETTAQNAIKKPLIGVFLKYFEEKCCTIQNLDLILHRNSRKVGKKIAKNASIAQLVRAPDC